MGLRVSKQTAMWLLILAVVGAALLAIQVIRVNQPKPVGPETVQRNYTDRGPLTPSEVEIEANGVYTHKIDLNRRMKLTGSFKTEKFKSSVAVLVLREADLDSWKSGVAVKPVVKTNIVPGGNVSPVLEPGVYYLIVDNRHNDAAQVVSTEFAIE